MVASPCGHHYISGLVTCSTSSQILGFALDSVQCWMDNSGVQSPLAFFTLIPFVV